MQNSLKYSNEVIIEENKSILEENTNEEIIDEEELTIDNFQIDSEYITSPAYIDKYNFITKDDILLT
jgi:ABC-type cobalamin/Fe3+-siderophores transport system ATPase subunit